MMSKTFTEDEEIKDQPQQKDGKDSIEAQPQQM